MNERVKAAAEMFWQDELALFEFVYNGLARGIKEHSLSAKLAAKGNNPEPIYDYLTQPSSTASLLAASRQEGYNEELVAA